MAKKLQCLLQEQPAVKRGSCCSGHERGIPEAKRATESSFKRSVGVFYASYVRIEAKSVGFRAAGVAAMRVPRHAREQRAREDKRPPVQ